MPVVVRAPKIKRAVKAIVQKPSGRWWDDERNVWVKKPGSAQAQSSQGNSTSYNVVGEKPTTADGGQSVSEEKKPAKKREKKPKAAPVAPVAPSVPRNPKFQRVDELMNYLAPGVQGDALSMSALADQQEEGLFEAPFSIREQMEKDGGSGRGAARQILREVVQDNAARSSFQLKPGRDGRGFFNGFDSLMEGGYVPKLKWDKEADYRLGRALEALGWRVDWTGKGAPPAGDDPRVRATNNYPRGFSPVHRPGGSVPVAKSQSGQIHTAVIPSKDAYDRLKSVLSEAFRRCMEMDYVKEFKTVNSNDLMAEVLAVAPDTPPADVWASTEYLSGVGALLGALTLSSKDRNGKAPRAGLSAEDGVLWYEGRACAFNIDRLDRSDLFGPPTRGPNGEPLAAVEARKDVEEYLGRSKVAGRQAFAAEALANPFVQVGLYGEAVKAVWRLPLSEQQKLAQEVGFKGPRKYLSNGFKADLADYLTAYYQPSVWKAAGFEPSQRLASYRHASSLEAITDAMTLARTYYDRNSVGIVVPANLTNVNLARVNSALRKIEQDIRGGTHGPESRARLEDARNELLIAVEEINFAASAREAYRQGMAAQSL